MRTKIDRSTICAHKCGAFYLSANQKEADDNAMSWFLPDKERDRFYLLPGMGGKALRRKKNAMLVWATLAGLLVSITVAGVLYWLHTRSFGVR